MREEILNPLDSEKQDTEKFDMDELVRACKDFSGRNIERILSKEQWDFQ